jgi:3-hydroxybutyrate dehydrogenase
MLKAKIALVTGSTRGIGAATATALAAQGCHVMLNGFGEADEIERQRAALADQHGVTVAYHGADLADLSQIEALMRQTREELGAVDILVNNAVIRYFHRIDDFVVENWDHALAVNLSAPFHLIRLALPYMRKRGWGRIINFSSVLGLGARSGRVDYVTTKTALLGLTRATAAETRAEGNITCNALCPGSVLTPNTESKIAELAEAEGLSPEAAREQYLAQRKQPTDFINPARVAEFIVFLCRDESRDITGAALPIDSGRSATWLD